MGTISKMLDAKQAITTAVVAKMQEYNIPAVFMVGILADIQSDLRYQVQLDLLAENQAEKSTEPIQKQD